MFGNGADNFIRNKNYRQNSPLLLALCGSFYTEFFKYPLILHNSFAGDFLGEYKISSGVGNLIADLVSLPGIVNRMEGFW